MPSFRQNQWIFFCLVAVLVMSTPSFSEDAHLEVTAKGKVIVDGVFHLSPLSKAPSDPEEGDLYFDAENKNLLFFNDGVWNKMTLMAHEWEYSDWSDCSTTCGGGTQTRTAVCTRSDGVEVPESYCGDEPVTNQECNTQSCTDCRYTNPKYYWSYMPDYKETHINWYGVLSQNIYSKVTSYTSKGYLYTKGSLIGTYTWGNVYQVCRKPAE